MVESKNVSSTNGELNTDDMIGQIDRLRLRSHRAGRAHYLAAHRSGTMQILLGIPAVIFSTAVGTAIFGTLASSPHRVVVVVAGAVSVASAVLSALQIFLGYPERSENHRIAGSHYMALKRQLDVEILHLKAGHGRIDDRISELSAFVNKFNALEAESPRVPDRFYDRARQEQAADTEGI
ncbi:SLATT domain-containing protein [Nocardia wallacei]|uniref:SLATT domain-containing protein n=1 Tax=Nocardia wallacei TaxID=480035 RepID=UPI002457FD50|nr:SLATT domain-containing protein [Nocardia wallacei]